MQERRPARGTGRVRRDQKWSRHAGSPWRSRTQSWSEPPERDRTPRCDIEEGRPLRSWCRARHPLRGRRKRRRQVILREGSNYRSAQHVVYRERECRVVRVGDQNYIQYEIRQTWHSGKKLTQDYRKLPFLARIYQFASKPENHLSNWSNCTLRWVLMPK